MTNSVTSLMTKYEPKRLADYTTFDLRTMTVIHGYPKGTLTRPLLLVGPPGCGKTQLARLLAAEIIPEMTPADIRFVDVADDPSLKTVKSVAATAHTFARNAQNLRAIILDEADEFTKPAMAGLKALMTKFPTLDKGVFFILTANSLSGISAPVQSRCKILEIPAPTVLDVLPVAENVLNGEGLSYSKADLQAALTKDSSGLSSFRDMWNEIEDIMTRRSMP